MIDRDPWDPVPEPATATLTPAEADRITGDLFADLIDAQFTDPQLPQDLLHKVIHELRRAASYQSGPLSEWAGELLQAMWHRSQTRVPFGEPHEPAWSLDPERRGPSRGE